MNRERKHEEGSTSMEPAVCWKSIVKSMRALSCFPFSPSSPFVRADFTVRPVRR